MKARHLSYWSLLICIILYACKSSAPIGQSIEVVNLDTIDIRRNPALEIYRASAQKKFDLIHTTLELSFNWDSAFCYGTANILLSPHFYPQNKLYLDAKGMDIISVKLQDSLGQKNTAPFSYNDSIIHIDLQKYYSAKDSLRVQVEYIAKPNQLPGGNGKAIKDNIGMYFINPRGEEPNKPRQIWTQGEPESNSCWFPTIDKPNQKMTQEIHIRVDSTFQTLSNGKLLFQVENGDGTRTDYWMQDQAHAPYLTMIAVGEYAIVKDEWKEKEVAYYVEKEYEAYARNIFPNTVEMLDFFSDVLKYDYPWDKYNQVVVRDYVSGAMENTGAVIYGEFMQGDAHYLVDNAEEEIVAHELFHHWFGDLVTCESWSNLPLNESFATYGEVLWVEHKYGQDAADYHRNNDFEAYRYEARLSKEKMIRYYYENPDDLFDAHSYQKGGCILHMLRAELGDDAFFAGLNQYLQKFAYKSAEIHDLRLVFEEITGRDLQPFFNQWFFAKGHPEIDFSYQYSESEQSLNLMIKQVQSGDGVPLAFHLNTDLEIIFTDGQKVLHPIEIRKRNTNLNIPLDRMPAVLRLDANNKLLAEVNQELSSEEAWALFKHGEDYLDRRAALIIAENNADSIAQQLLIAATEDPFWRIRESAFYHLQRPAFEKPSLVKEKCLKARFDENSNVRAAAYTALAEYFEDPQYLDSIKPGLIDTSYEVRAACINAIFLLDSGAGLRIAKENMDSKSYSVQTEISAILSQTRSEEYMPYFLEQLKTIPEDYAYSFILSFGDYLQTQNTRKQQLALEPLYNRLEQANAWWVRLSIINVMADLKSLAEQRINASNVSALLANEELLLRDIRHYLEDWKKEETESSVKSLINSSLSK